MRTSLFVVLALFTSACASWGFRDVALETITIGAMAADAGLTIHGQQIGMIEGNPVLGAHPSPAAIITYTATSALLHVAVASLLDGEWRTFWQGSVIGLEGWCIFSNAYLISSH